MKTLIITVVLIFLSTPVFAIIVEPTDKPDPFAKTEVCSYPEIVSYGSYIYSWPSKFDWVFDPFVSLIATCPASGYVSYTKDFDALSEIEKEKIGAYLSDNPWQNSFDGPDGFQAMLDHMESIYEIRTLSLDDRAYLYRARAWLWADHPKADEYRSRALAIQKTILTDGSAEGMDLIAHLYIVGFYTWRLGSKEEAENYFARASNVEWIDDEGEQQVGSSYVDELIAEIKEGKADNNERFAAPN